jgi:hypothetical protein
MHNMRIRHAGPAGPAAHRGRPQSLLPIAVFDVIGPLVAYSLLRSAGYGELSALVLSGVFPAFSVALAVVRYRRLDVIGGLVLTGIIIGSVIGLVSGSPRLFLLEGSTAIFGLVCLASLWWRRPLIFRFALESIGPDTPKGRDFAGRWRYEGFRRTFRVMTVVWGIAYLAEALVRIIVVELTSGGTALAISKIMPYAVAGVLAAWTALYGQRAGRRGERLGAAAAAVVPGAAAEISGRPPVPGAYAAAAEGPTGS